MQSGKTYREEVHTVTCKGKTVTIRNFTPEDTGEQRERIKKEISETLYEIFSKYGQTAERD
jgi:hypothetical protein